MGEELAISLQLSTDNVTVAVRIDGTPYSPDVFDDLARRALSLLKDATSKDTYQSFTEVDEALNTLEVLFSDDDD
jgi:hypothetical protein